MTEFAFFDVDDTVVQLKTMFSFQDFYFRHAGAFSGLLGPVRAARFNAVRRRYRAQGRPREDLNRMYYRSFRGRRPDQVSMLAQQWYKEIRQQVREFYFPEVVEALKAHQAAGDEVVFVSGSMVEILRPIAEDLNVQHMLATRVVISGDRYTGEIVPPQTIGLGKARAVVEFLASHGLDGSTCWAYGDDHSDIPMLSVVGHPVVVSSARDMAEVAKDRGWQILEPLSRTASVFG